MTPEGKVKAAIKRFLKQFDCWSDWPVPGGYGKSTLDCLVIRNGCALWIEAKAPGGEPTKLQWQTIDALKRNGCRTIVIDTTDTNAPAYGEVREWMEWVAP